MNELSGQLTDLADVLGGAARRLAEQLREAPGWRQRFALMDQFLLRRMACGPRPSPQVGWAWRRLVTTGGTVPIGQVADEVGWSHKHLIVQFRRQAGLRPKTAARLIRFDRVWRHVDQRRPLDWGQVAADTGYADQAHLIRDFRQFTGITPTGYQARHAPPHPAPRRQAVDRQTVLSRRSGRHSVGGHECRVPDWRAPAGVARRLLAGDHQQRVHAA